MPEIIDFHTHIFPDQVAEKAIPLLEAEGNVSAVLNGTRRDLLSSMERSGIGKSVINSIATRPEQFDAILSFSKKIRSHRLIPFPSFHPSAPEAVDQIQTIKNEGFSGVKLHPYYQNFYMTDASLLPIYEALADNDLIVLMHTGFDIAFPHERRADPAAILTVIDQFPNLRIVTSHFGAWDLWSEVQEQMIGKEIYMDLSFALEFLDPTLARAMIMAHPSDFLLFGSDSPWSDQQVSMNLVRQLKLPRNKEEKILGLNAKKLLALT